MVVVLSMHRSGSSLLTGILANSGLNVGKKEVLIEPKKGNAKGFWERKDVIAANESLFRGPLCNHLVPDLNFKSLAESIEEYDLLTKVSEALADEDVALLKDPRFCLTLDRWLPHIDSTKIIFLYRHPLEVAASLKERNQVPFPIGLALWEHYNYQALESSQTLPCYYVDFAKLVKDAKSVVTNIIEWLTTQDIFGLSVNEEMLNKIYDQKLIHHSWSKIHYDLTSSQKALYTNLVENPYSINRFHSESMEQTLLTWYHFIGLGFHPGKGRFIDKELMERNKHLRERIHLTNQRKVKLEDTINHVSERNKQLRERNAKLNKTVSQTKRDNSRLQKSIQLFISSRTGKFCASIYKLFRFLRFKSDQETDVFDRLKSHLENPVKLE